MKQKDLPPQKSNAGIKNISGRIDSDVLEVADFYSHALFIQLFSG